MSRLLNNVKEICQLSLRKRCTPPLTDLDDAIFYDEFIVCIFGNDNRTIAVFDPNTWKEISMLPIGDSSCTVQLVRLQNWSLGIYDWEYSSTDNCITIYFHPFAIDKNGIVERCAPIAMLKLSQELSEALPNDQIYFFNSLDEQMNDVVALAICFQEDFEVFDICGANSFTMDKRTSAEGNISTMEKSTFTIKNGELRGLIGRTLWAEHQEGMKQYDLSTGAILRTMDLSLQSIDFAIHSIVYKNRFIVDQTRGEESLRIIDTFNAEVMLLTIPLSKKYDLVFRDIFDDGRVLFIAYNDALTRNPMSMQIWTFRINVPSLTDIAKECIYAQKEGGMTANT